MFRTHRSQMMVGILLMLALVLTACPAPAPSTGEDMSGDAPAAAEGPVTAHINWSTEPPTADPALSTDTTSSEVITSLFVTLTATDVETQAAVPYLAESWESNEAGDVWTFTLRSDIPWVSYDPATGEVSQVMDADGNPMMVTAGDIEYGVKRTLDPNTGSQYAYILYPIAGAQELNEADPEADNFQELMDSVGVEALDDSTIQFTLNYAAGFFPQLASMPQLSPQPQMAIEAHGDVWTEPENIVTNGPFLMEEWVHGDSLTLVRNEMFPLWGSDFANGNIERVEGVMIEEASTAFALYEDNELDTAAVPQDLIDQVRANIPEQFNNPPENCTYYYGFVTQQGATQDLNVRKALSMAIDRETLVNQVTRGGQIPANAFTNPLNFGSFGGDPDIAPWALTEDAGGTGYADAVAMAQEMMAEAGYAEGEGLDILLMHNVSEGHARIAQAVQAMWLAAFPNMNATIETQEWQVYLQTIDKDSPLEAQPNAFRLGWCADYPHANNWLYEVFNSDAGANRVRMSTDDPQIGDLVAQYNELTETAQTASPEEALELYKQAEQLLVDDMAIIAPIYFYTTVNATKPWLERSFESGNLRLHQWVLDAEAQSAAR